MKSWKGERIYSRDAAQDGYATGSTHLCGMEGCTGRRVSVKWPDGRHTFPCSKGLEPYMDGWRIV